MSEAELAAEDSDAGCGCGYPAWVTEEEVTRSNAILARLRETAQAFPELQQRLGALPMHLVAEVGGIRVGLLHGDATALNGWDFSWERLKTASHTVWVQECFRQAAVRIFASTHTCLPVLREYNFPEGRCVIINNGAAGMPNFAGTRYGLTTRISVRWSENGHALYGTSMEGICIETVPIHYDATAWQRRFLANWPPGSPAYESYLRRIQDGPAFTVAYARPDAMMPNENG